MTALIVGNGPSRKLFDLRKVCGDQTDSVVYGCNALYRDFKPTYELPHFLVAIDDGMITEIESSTFPSSRVIIPSPDERWEPAEFNPSQPRSNAGMNAMEAAIRDGHEKIVCIGFDFLLCDRAALGNVYEDTDNYSDETRATQFDHRNRSRFLSWFCSKYDGTEFVFVYPMEEVDGRDFYTEPFSSNENINLEVVEGDYEEGLSNVLID